MRQILKEALTVCLYIDEIQYQLEISPYSVHDKKIRLVRKVVEKFLTLMKKSGYDQVKDRWNKTYYERILDHLDCNRHEDSVAIYLTYIQMQFHDFCRHYLPKRMGYGNYRRDTKHVSYYKSTLRRLMD